MHWQPHKPTAVGDLGRQEDGRDEMTFRKLQISVATQERDWKRTESDGPGQTPKAKSKHA